MKVTERMPARCVQEGDEYHGQKVLAVLPGAGKNVRIISERSPELASVDSVHMDDLVVVRRELEP